MSSYSYYDPNAAAQSRRDGSRERLMALMVARQKYNQQQQAEAEAERQQALREAEEAERQGLGSMWGNVGQGAMTGGMIGGPWGAAIGGGAGLLLGGMSEMQNRKSYARGHGDKGYGTFDALKDTFARVPHLNEVGSVMGGLGAAGSQYADDYKGQREAKRYAQMSSDRAIADWRKNQAPQQEAMGQSMYERLKRQRQTASGAGGFSNGKFKDDDLVNS